VSLLSDAPPIDRRFERLGRLITEDAVAMLARKHVVVCGMGGVGSWTAEALARSGVGRLTLIDFDAVSITTLNRHLPGETATIGTPKVEVMAARARSVNPLIAITTVREKIEPESLHRVIPVDADFVVDAIDQLGNKSALLAHCIHVGLPVVSSTGAGGRRDPTQIAVSDLSLVSSDPLARLVRVYLRTRHDFGPLGPFGIPAVWSREPSARPIIPRHAEAEKSRTELPPGTPLTSGMRNVIMGTACWVTSVFGMHCAAVVVNTLVDRHSIRG